MAGTRKKLGLWTAVIALVTALVGLVETHRFREEVKNYDASTETAAKQLREIAEAIGNGQVQGRTPVFAANPWGSNMEFQGGYEIQPPVEPAERVAGTISEYPPGRYRIEDAPSSRVIIAAVAETVSSFLREHPGTRASIVEFIGCADGISVRHGALYQGDPYNFNDFPYYSIDRGRIDRMNLISGVTQLDNKKIAFLRAYSAHAYMSTAPFTWLEGAKPIIATKTEKAIGGSLRKVIVKVTLENALADSYSQLSTPAQWYVDRRRKVGTEGSVSIVGE